MQPLDNDFMWIIREKEQQCNTAAHRRIRQENPEQRQEEQEWAIVNYV